MAKQAKKQHEKKRQVKGVIGPDGNFYKVGTDIELRQCYDVKNRGMFWCHKNKDLKWAKRYKDEVVQ